VSNAPPDDDYRPRRNFPVRRRATDFAPRARARVGPRVVVTGVDRRRARIAFSGPDLERLGSRPSPEVENPRDQAGEYQEQ